MTWKQFDGRNHPLERIGVLTIRLLRLSVHQQLARGQEQLGVHGLDFNLADAYKKDVIDPKKEKEYSALDIVESGDF